MKPPRAADSGEIAAADGRLLLRVLTAVKRGDFSQRLPNERSGSAGRVFDALNDIIELNYRHHRFVRWTRSRAPAARLKEGAGIGRRMQLSHAPGAWGEAVESVNALVWGLAQPITETNRVIRAVAHGDLSQRAAADVDGRPLKGEFARPPPCWSTGLVDQLCPRLGVGG